MLNFEGEVAKDNYVSTGMNVWRNRFTIKLKDGFDYFVLSTLEKVGSTKRKIYFIQKNGKYYKLSDEVKKKYLIDKRKCSRLLAGGKL